MIPQSRPTVGSTTFGQPIRVDGLATSAADSLPEWDLTDHYELMSEGFGPHSDPTDYTTAEAGTVIRKLLLLLNYWWVSWPFARP